jgi:hypothetical protein
MRKKEKGGERRAHGGRSGLRASSGSEVAGQWQCSCRSAALVGPQARKRDEQSDRSFHKIGGLTYILLFYVVCSSVYGATNNSLEPVYSARRRPRSRVRTPFLTASAYAGSCDVNVSVNGYVRHLRLHSSLSKPRDRRPTAR